MKPRRITLAAALLGTYVLMSSACLATDSMPAGEAGARAASLARFEAAVHGDTGALEKLLADDLDYCHSNGDCQGKRAYIDSMKAGTMKYRSIEPTVDSVKMLHNAAIILGHAKVNATRDGNDLDMTIGYTSVMVWRGHRWQLTSWRSVTLPAAAAR
jgi:uncharacterized protein DUF4440